MLTDPLDNRETERARLCIGPNRVTQLESMGAYLRGWDWVNSLKRYEVGSGEGRLTTNPPKGKRYAY